MEQSSSRPVSEMDRSEADEMRDAETLAGLANAPSAGASAGIGERPSSSGAKRNTKTRKPYTITKQREKWTDQEHSRFLDALRMYGRAWRRIEEHIGSKTAVQIRSHAQKFFSKLEKQEMSGAKGEGLPESISIPPPRPKRKPSHPYPRKPFSGVGSYDGAATAEGAGSQDQLPAQQRLPDYSHLAPKLNGSERMDVAVAAVAQAASAAAAAAAAAVISAAGEQIRAHMQACPPQCFPFFGLAPSMLAQLSLQQLNPQGMMQASQAALPPQYSGQYSGLTPGQVAQPTPARLCSLSKLQRSEFSGTSGDPLSALPMRTAERRTNANGSDGNSACSREDPMAEDGRLPGDTGATSRQGSGISRLGAWPPMVQPQAPAAQHMLSELYYSWNNMTSLSAAAAAAADANTGAEAAAAAQNGDWRAVVQAAAAAASQWEVQMMNAHAVQSRSNGVQLPVGPAQAAAAPLSTIASRCIRTNKMHASESKVRRQGLRGSDGSGTNAAEDRVEAVGVMANCDAADEESPSRDFDDSLYELGNKRTSGSLDTNNSNAETGMKGEGELAYQVDAEGEGSGSNPTGNGDSGNNSNEGSGGEGKRGSNKGSNSGSGNETDPCDKDGNGTSKDPTIAAAPQSVRESIAGNEAGGSGGSGNATRVSNGATVPTGLSKQQREGSDEGCTSLEHPHPQPRAKSAAVQAPKASAFLQHAPGAAVTAATAHDFSTLNGAQGLIESAQMAQAASALQQSGLAPYLLQQQYTAQLAQLQQAAMMNWGGQKMSAFDMFNSLMGLQALAGPQPGHLPNPALTARTPANSGGAGELHSAPSGMASFDTLAYAASAAAAAMPAAAPVDAVAAAGLPPAGSGVLPRPPASPTAAAAAAGQIENSSVSGSGQTQQSQGFMPYKWRHHPLPRGVHQLQPGGLLSLGKRSASASLAEPPRKRAVSGNLP